MMHQGAGETFSQPGQALSIGHLLDDVLYAIFSKCDVKTLGRLCRVCRRFNRLLQSDTVWLRHCRRFTLFHSKETSKLPRKIKLKEQCRISLNWVKKFYRERILLRHNPRQLPWMQYLDQTLWISTQNTVKCYKVRSNGSIEEVPGRLCMLQQKPGVKITYTTMPDVSRFVVKDDILVSGCRDGSLHVFDCQTGRKIVKFPDVHRTDTLTVDFHDSCIISGSVDKTVKILSNAFCNNASNIVHTSIDIGDRIWSVGMAPQGSTFAVGTAGCNGEPPLSVWDVNRGQLISYLGSYRYGAGILDMRYENEHTLLSCGYDSYLRMWDVRSGRCVVEWEEPFDTTLYCIQSDRDVSMVTGTARYGMVRLWDKRSSSPIQVYYLGPKNSPVYSIAFDASRLYTALDLCIVMADFSILPP